MSTLWYRVNSALVDIFAVANDPLAIEELASRQSQLPVFAW